MIEEGEHLSSDDLLLRKIPRRAFETWKRSQHAHTYMTEKVPGLFGRKVQVVSGKSFGGSSGINAGQWSRPDDRDYDGWGVEGWDGSRARRGFRKAEEVLGVGVPGVGLRQSFVEDWLEAGRKVGFKVRDDGNSTNGKVNDGVWVNWLAGNNGRRLDSCSAYRPEENCRNLRVVSGVRVKRIVMGEESGGVRRATTLKYTQINTDPEFPETQARMDIRMEVILTAGAFGSPKALMLSGIGPKEQLEKHGIEVLKDLPVGQGINARPRNVVLAGYFGKPLAKETDLELLNSAQAAEQWNLNGSGVLGVSIGGTLGADPDDGYTLDSSTTTETIWDLEEGKQLDQIPGLNRRVHVSVCLLADPKSYGSLSLKSADPKEPLAFQPNFFADQRDLDTMAACVKRVRALYEKFNPTCGMKVLVPNNTLAGSTETLEAYLRGSTEFSYHIVGGAALGKVLEWDMRVKGFENLRVIDASAIPKPVRGGPMATIYMLAEEAAAIIADEYNLGVAPRNVGSEDDEATVTNGLAPSPTPAPSVSIPESETGTSATSISLDASPSASEEFGPTPSVVLPQPIVQPGQAESVQEPLESPAVAQVPPGLAKKGASFPGRGRANAPGQVEKRSNSQAEQGSNVQGQQGSDNQEEQGSNDFLWFFRRWFIFRETPQAVVY